MHDENFGSALPQAGSDVRTPGSPSSRYVEAEHRAAAADAVIEGQKRALELVLHGAPLSAVLEVIVRTVETQSSNAVLGSILLLDPDGVHLRHGAAPSLPEPYCAAIDGIEIGPNVGSCGTAASTGKTVVVRDVATDPLWKDFKDLALAHGLRACWSTPIVSSKGAVLGTFALYHREPAIPTPRDIAIVELLGRTATLIIERQQWERAQAAERERVIEILESTQDSFFAVDAGFRIVMVNKNQERVSRVSREDSIGRQLFDVFPVSPDSKFWSEYQRVARERVAVHFEDYYAPLDIWAEVHATPTADGGLAVFYRDISARKRLENEREELLARERKSRVEAEAARAQAESANRMKDEFLATVSHELRTPLNAILGWAALLQGGTLDAARRANALSIIDRNARTQARLIEDLLDVSRILQGKFVLAVGPVELVRVVQAALDAVKPAAEAKGIRIQPILDSHATIVGDPERLQQVSWNLLSNAIKFTPKGGRVQVTLRKVASYVELTVADTGVGIPSDFLPHVFEPFRQAERSATRRSGGLGLGLSIVHSLVQMHGGIVTVASDGEGKGATFTVQLPMAPLRADRPPVSSPDPGEAQRTFDVPEGIAGLRILVVDDEKDTRELLAFLLGEAEARVTLAANAAEAFDAIQTSQFDLIVSDVGMPGEDGLSFMRRLRQLPVERGGAHAGRRIDRLRAQ